MAGARWPRGTPGLAAHAKRVMDPRTAQRGIGSRAWGWLCRRSMAPLHRARGWGIQLNRRAAAALDEAALKSALGAAAFQQGGGGAAPTMRESVMWRWPPPPTSERRKPARSSARRGSCPDPTGCSPTGPDPETAMRSSVSRACGPPPRGLPPASSRLAEAPQMGQWSSGTHAPHSPSQRVCPGP